MKSFTPDSKSVCRIRDGSTNSYLSEDRAIEEFLKTIEPRYNTALNNLIEGRIDRQSIYVIAGFAAYVIACSPTAMRMLSRPLKSAVETMAVMHDERGLLPLPPEELGGRRLAEILESGDIQIEVDPKYPQAIGIQNIFRHIAAFGNFKWEILLNPFDQSPFFTSDFPAAVEETRDWRVVNRVVPLAPNVAIRIRPDISINRKRADFSFANFGYLTRAVSHRELVEINQLIVRCAEDTIFYRDEFAWVRKFITKNRHYRVDLIISKRRMALFWFRRRGLWSSNAKRPTTMHPRSRR